MTGLTRLNFINKAFSIHTYLFYVFVFILPFNLGKHFFFTWSYVNGLLVDYFVPVIYVQDILLLLILIIWILHRNLKLKKLFNLKIFPVLFLLLITGLLSVFVSVRIEPAISYFLKSVLYFGLFFYVVYEFRNTINRKTFFFVLSISIFLLSVMAVIQWIKQGSVFNNYLFFGEQPYHYYTYGIVKENFLGITKIPAYGTFRHPNVLGGFLAIILIWFFCLVRFSKYFYIPLALGVIALFFTLSFTAWLAFILGLLFIHIKRYQAVVLTMVVCMFLFVFPLFPGHESASLLRRSSLLKTSFDSISDNILFGVGFNNGMLSSKEARFMQPVHNVFVLLLQESGIVALLLFIVFLIQLLKRKDSDKIMFISLLQMLILFSFDHYFYTIHQTQLLFLLTSGIVYSYNSTREDPATFL